MASFAKEMAEDSDVSAVKVFNYICGTGGVAELSHLLKHPSPLAKKTNPYEVILWFEIQKKLDPENRLALIHNHHGKVIGIRIDLKKQMCLKYATTDSCKSAKRCKFWHLCKEFIEGTCKGTGCQRSHDFHDEDNKEKTMELGFGSKPSGSLKGIVAGSFMQVCLMYLKNDCVSDNCPYLHICPSAVRATPCECVLSHNFAEPHNRCVLGQYGFKPPRTSEVDVVRCNTLVPAKNQKPFDASKMNLHSKVPKGEPVRSAGLLQDTGKTKLRASAALLKLRSHHDAAVRMAEPLPDKVFNFICGKGGVASLSDLLQHPSPLSKKFPAQEHDAKIWLQVQAQPGGHNVARIILLESQEGEIIGVRVNCRKKICRNYSKGSCKSSNACHFWHVCKGFLEGNCQGDCGLSHNFHDDDNVQKVKKLEMEKLPGGTLRSIVANSLPQVCQMYLNNSCLSSCCPYLHICSAAVQGHPCSCGLSHDLTDNHNTAILKQYDLAPEKTKFNIMQCNILIPKSKQQKFFEDKAYSASSQANLNMMGSPVPLMSIPVVQQRENVLDPQLQGSSKGTEKKKRQRPRHRRKKSNRQGEAAGESQHTNADDMKEESSDSVSDNEDVQDKPNLYSSSKFAVDTNYKPSSTSWQEDLRKNETDAMTSMNTAKKSRAQSMKSLKAFLHEPVSEMTMNVAPEVDLIDLCDDESEEDWKGVDSSINDLWTGIEEPPLLSQVDEFFFSSPFSSNVAGSLSQSSTLSNPADQISPESNSDKLAAQSIFQYICNEHNGQVPYAVISECQDMFPSEVIDTAAWFRENHNRFITIENSTGEIEAIRTHSTKARICFRYLMAKQGCKDPKCFRYHVCKHYLANGVCPLGTKCRFSHSHSLKSPHNTRITKQIRLNSFSEEQLRVLVSASVPEVCLDYNSPSKRCTRGLRCIGIHICKYFVMGNCKKGEDCPLSHQKSLKTPHSKLVLGRYNLTKVPPGPVLNVLLIRQRRPSEKLREQPKTVTAAQRRDIPQYICLDFLLGHCSNEQLCDQYHYNVPYMWQYEDPSSNQLGHTWTAFTQSENEAIEQQFCDVNVLHAELEHIMIPTPPSVLIDPGEGQIKVNFDVMKAETGFGHVPLRRLSTKPAVSPKDHALSTQWVWFWLDEKSNIWREYGSELMHKIELRFSSGASIFQFKERDEDFKLFFGKVPMYQQSTKPPVTIKRVRRRPVFRSLSEIQRLQRPLELPIPLEPESPQSRVASAPSGVPSHWTSVPESEEFTRVCLSKSSDQFKLVEGLFRQSMSESKAVITSIERVQNPFMWAKYARKKEQMEKKARIKDNPLNEKLLFHGTDFQNVDSICAENIDWRALEEDRAAQFGEGAYFTKEAALSNLYCKQDSESFRYVFLAEVLVGSFVKGEPSMKRPPVKDEAATKKELYDSCVDNVEKPTIFVLFDADQYYPSFLIKYKIKSKVVC